jgi:hypothetical protein
MPSHTFLTVRDGDHSEVKVDPTLGRLELTTWADTATDYGCVSFTAPADVMAEIVVKLTTWPDVLDLVARQSVRQAGADAADRDADDLAPIARDYFRRGFALFGREAAEAGIAGVDHG